VRVINLQLGFEDLWRVSFIKKILLYLKKQRQYKKLLSTELMRIRPDITISVLRREINFINSIPDGSRKIGELHVNRSNYRNFIGQDSNFIKCVFSRYWMNNLVKHLKRLDRMVVLTATAQNDWPELSNVTLIPDPLPFKVENVSSLTTKRVICIGRYAYEKGIDLLLRVWAKVQDRGHDWVLDIYGVGDQTSYRHLFQELGIDDRRCHLYDSLTDVQNAYLNSSIFVLPSRFEGFSMVIIEAMSCGVPVVSFDCENGPRNIITNGQNGFLVPPFDIDVYAERLLTLMQNDKLRQSMGLRARQTSYQYQIEDIALRWKALFDEVVTGQ
jgi:glycosyltransferase involved in cell wall biosynthesis